MTPPKAHTANNSPQQMQAAPEQRRYAENAKAAQSAAELLFPGEKWQTIANGIYLSPNRPIGKKTSYEAEKLDAEILHSLGGTVYLVPESRKTPGKKYDAIVNGDRFEFKNMKGGEDTLKHQFLRSRSQAPNVFINLDESHLSKHQIIKALIGARNSPEYVKGNNFSGGKIILKIKGQANLAFLSVDDLQLSNG
jgi:hypothetical protein